MTILYKYVMAPMYILVLASMLIIVGNSADKSATFGFGPPFITCIIWLIIFVVRLRSVTAGVTGLTINGDKKIDYRNIEYVSETIMFKPCLITIKYIEPTTSSSQTILIMPRATFRTFRNAMREHEMTEYVRQQIFINNPTYSREREPHRWRTVAFVLLTITASCFLGELLFLCLSGSAI